MDLGRGSKVTERTDEQPRTDSRSSERGTSDWGASGAGWIVHAKRKKRDGGTGRRGGSKGNVLLLGTWHGTLPIGAEVD